MQLQLRKPVTLGILIMAVVALGGGSAFGAALLASKAPTSVLACMTTKGALVLPTKSTCAKGLIVIHLPLSTKTGPRGPAGPRGRVGPRGTAGSPGKRGVAGPPGPTVAYSNAAQSGLVQIASTNTTVATLDVPAGSYVVTASIVLEGLVASASASCTLSGDNESWGITLGHLVVHTISFTTPVAEGAAATISLLCSAVPSEEVSASGTLVAIKVGALGLS